MPTRSINPFATTSPSSSPSLDAINEKREQPRRTSFTKGNKFTSLFGGGSPKSRDAAALRDALVAQQQALLNSPSPQQLNLAPISLPSISLTTATGEKMPAEPKTLFQPPSQEDARRLARAHAQFGPLGSQSHRCVSQFPGGEFAEPVEDEPPYYYLITTYISYLILIVFGHVRDFFGKRFRRQHYSHLEERDGYAPLNSDFDNFYTRRLKIRINDCFSRPTTGVPGRFITLLDRKSDDGNNTFKMLGTTTETLNMSSYNYLGFAQSEGPCADAAEAVIRKYGVTMASPRSDVGTSDLSVEVEELVASFVGKPASMVFSMGFVTNATTFPTLVGKGCLMISDELNHSSIRFGSRLSGAMIEMFKHNDMRDLERKLREAISQGQPRTHRPWKKILVAVEGLYSMEGTMCNLPALVELKKKYKFNLYVDEAHSVGALGPNGRGVCDYFGIDPSEVDILMGTFTKSFGANGGYIAAEKSIIDKLRVQNAGMLFAESPTPPVLVQIASALRLITGDLNPGQGEERLQRLAFNSRYLRLGLKRLGFIVYGHDDSPIIPLLLYNPAKMPAFSHEMLKRKISVVVVGYPATPLVSSRARFCVSAAHTKDDLDRMLAACDEAGDLLQLKFSSGVAGGAEPEEFSLEEKDSGLRERKAVKPPRWRLEDVLKRGVEDVQGVLC
ncbi:serine palmitoyltransferas-like protein 2 [Melanomma pulvis-pyrius CBS 109.77]|uniref:Serine palmitoyltransferas-like protein 2 n=1 Tax=Melanomma pulvis-pyrius CBS 109.77 TaxID=1314802 RepID=A0A6A6WQC4_9PLEO|nr:serine palmitoyltransferas-like protein 2 [Melanomma pulvis-pyrius CBS 109.77]